MSLPARRPDRKGLSSISEKPGQPWQTSVSEKENPIACRTPALINRGRACLFDRKFAAAVADLRKAYELSPDLPVAHTWLATAFLEKGDHAAAVKAADRALNLDLKQAMAWYVRGTALFHRGELDKAIADFDEAARLNRNDPATSNNRGIAFQKPGDDNKAIASFHARP